MKSEKLQKKKKKEKEKEKDSIHKLHQLLLIAKQKGSEPG